MNDWQFGDRVHFTWTLARNLVCDPDEHGRNQWNKRWTYRAWPTQKEPAPRAGLVVGVRTLSDGYNDGGYEEPVTYYPQRYFRAYLIAFDMRRKPVLVLPEHITSAEQVAA